MSEPFSAQLHRVSPRNCAENGGVAPPSGAPSPSFRDRFRDRLLDQLLERRTVMLDGTLDTSTATMLCAQLMTLDADGDDPITLLVNSHGGPLDAVFAVLDTVALLGCPVDTTCIGQAVGTSVAVVASGTGRRRASATARFVLRLADASLEGSARRVGEDAAELMRRHGELIDRLAAATGQERQLVARDVERGRALTADEAIGYGLVDELAQR